MQQQILSALVFVATGLLWASHATAQEVIIGDSPRPRFSQNGPPYRDVGEVVRSKPNCHGGVASQ